jgi:hypothetical protein
MNKNGENVRIFGVQLHKKSDDFLKNLQPFPTHFPRTTTPELECRVLFAARLNAQFSTETKGHI